MAVMARWKPSATTKATSTRYAFTMDELSNEALLMEMMAKNHAGEALGARSDERLMMEATAMVVEVVLVGVGVGGWWLVLGGGLCLAFGGWWLLVVGWWNGRKVEWWSGGVVEWCSGGVAE